MPTFTRAEAPQGHQKLCRNYILCACAKRVIV